MNKEKNIKLYLIRPILITLVVACAIINNHDIELCSDKEQFYFSIVRFNSNGLN